VITLEKIINKTSHFLHYFSMIVLGFMALLITLDVLGRWLFRTPITGAVELVGNGLSILIFLSLAVTHTHKDHVVVDFVIEKLPQKVQAIFDSIINVVIFIIMFLMSTSIFIYANRLYQTNTITGDLEIPISIFAFICALGALLFALIAFVYALKSINSVVKQNES
jgi:TRAP-type transport system small permease protein